MNEDVWKTKTSAKYTEKRHKVVVQQNMNCCRTVAHRLVGLKSGLLQVVLLRNVLGRRGLGKERFSWLEDLKTWFFFVHYRVLQNSSQQSLHLFRRWFHSVRCSLHCHHRLWRKLSSSLPRLLLIPMFVWPLSSPSPFSSPPVPCFKQQP